MAKIERYICDIEGCENEAAHIIKEMQVIHINEEEVPIRNLVDVELDLCKFCMEKLITSGRYITSTNYMGFFKYHLK